MRTVDAVSVVVPVYNSEATLVELTHRLAAALGHLDRYEVIYVNDGSRDTSWRTIEQLAAQYDWVRGIDLMRNYGQHNALLCGIRAARFPVLVTLDDDLQHPPEEIPRLVARLEQGFDVVYGTRAQRQHGIWRSIASQATRAALGKVMGRETARNISPFRAFRTELRRAFAGYQSSVVHVDVLLTWGAQRFDAIQVRHDPRPHGNSHYTLPKLISYAFDLITGFSILPLRVASLVGFGFTLLGVVVFAYVLARYFLSGGSVPGFPFLASIIAIFAGAQLFALGLIGEYLGRVHVRLMDQPPYIVQSAEEQPGACEEAGR